MTWKKIVGSNGNVEWEQVPRKIPLRPFEIKQIQGMNLKAARHLPLESKKVWFQSKLEQQRISFMNDSIMIVVQRENALEDSM